MEILSYLGIALAFISFFYLGSLRNDKILPWNWPLVGMLPWLSCHVSHIHEAAALTFGQAGIKTFLLKGPWFANMDMLVTVDPANVQYILTTNFPNYPKGAEFMEIFAILGKWMSNSDSDRWKNQRKLAQVLLNNNQFHQFSAKASREKVEKGLIPVLDHVSEQGIVVNMQELFQRLTIDTSFISFTGYDTGCLSINFPAIPFAKAMDEALEVTFLRHVMPRSLWKLQSWLNIGLEKKMKEDCKIIDDLLNSCISWKEKELNNGKGIIKSKHECGVDLLTLYMKEDIESYGLNRHDTFLRDTVLGYILAGRDTTSATLTWFVWLLIKHPEVEEKIVEELKTVVPKNETEKLHLLGVQDLSKLTYLHAALCETLRLYPPFPFQHKVPIKPDLLPSGDRVDPSMRIIISVFAMGRMVSIWGRDCLEFKPERWISENGTIKHEPSYKFLSFSSGPRTCMGKAMAFTQLKSIVSAIIYNYRFELEEGHPVAPNVSIMLYMRNGLKVRVKRRSS